MRKFKRIILQESSQTLSSKEMLSLFGGAHLLIYSCVCTKAGATKKSGTVKVALGTNPESAILRYGQDCYGYDSATCAFRASV